MREVRTLKDTIQVYRLNYGWLADLVNDAACDLQAGQPIDQSLLDEIARYEWREDGQHVFLGDSDRVTSFAARTRFAPKPSRPTSRLSGRLLRTP